MRIALLGILLFCLPASAVLAQPEKPAQPAAPAPTGVTPDPELRTPKVTLHTFLRAMRDEETELATSCLDLGRLTKEAAATSGPSVAYKLHVLIKRLTDLSLEEDWRWDDIPDENEHADPFSLDQVAGSQAEAADLVLRRNKDDGNWRFSQDTCDKVEELYNTLEQTSQGTSPSEDMEEDEEITQPLPIRIRELFPVALRGKTFLIPDYQWICLLALIFIGLVADVATRWLLAIISAHTLGKLIGDERAATQLEIWRPIGRLVNAAMWYWGTKMIGLPPSLLNVLLVALKLFTIFAAAWTAFALINVMSRYLARKAASTDTKFDDLIVPMISKSLKALTACIAMLTAAQAFDVPLLGLMGGLGLGGAALAFASKDAVANFFGSITVVFDRPFEVGDWIVTEGAEGTVERVGFRSTRIRTFYNSLITLPNNHLTTAAVDNMGRRRYRRIKTTLGVQYDTTPEKLDAFCEGIRNLILEHPDTRKDYFHVYFNDFGASALEIMLYCFVQCPDWGQELQARHRLLADIVRLADTLDVQFAFPTTTVHLANPNPPAGLPDLDSPREMG